MQNNMASAWNLYLVFGLMAINNEPLELCTWHFVWEQINRSCNSYVKYCFQVNNYKHTWGGGSVKLAGYVRLI